MKGSLIFNAVKWYLTVVVFSTLLSTVGGCALFNGDGPQATVHVRSAHYLNPDIYGRASPVVLTIYQLKSQYDFQQANYNALTINSGKTLGNDLIDKNTFEIRPNDQINVDFPLSPNAQYLGIVAGYRNINQAVWHKIVKIEQRKNMHPVLNLDLQSQGFTLNVGYTHNFF